jgi:hypothetical protein
MKVGIDGGQAGPPIVGPAAATSVAVDAAGVYWTDSKGSVFVASDPSTARLLGSTGSPAYGVTLDAKYVYWINGASSIFRAPK